jgi:hypothetical protein
LNQPGRFRSKGDRLGADGSAVSESNDHFQSIGLFRIERFLHPIECFAFRFEFIDQNLIVIRDIKMVAGGARIFLPPE